MAVNRIGALFALLAVSAASQASVFNFFQENFDNVAGLTGNGWVMTNNSTPGGTTGWFQGNPGVFTSQSGADDSYIAANFENAGFGGNVDNWLITPVINFEAGDTFTFWTRTNGAFPGDNLEVLYSFGSTNTADFISAGTIGNYPLDWTSILGLVGIDAGLRLAFRYLVTDTSINGDYIGIDSFVVQRVPEPNALLLLGAGLALVPVAVRRRRASAQA